MRRIRLTVAYDGTNYCGWQIQPNGITIEEVLNKAICKLTGEEIQVIGASRTDSGVHARGNIAVFDTESRIPAERFSYALNQRLPKDIVVVKSDEVDLNWHPRYQDTLKTYEYHIINTKVPIPTERLYNYFVSFDLDVGQMRRGAAYLAGLAVGYWKNRDEIRENWQIGASFAPQMEEQQRRQLLKGWHRAVKCALAWAEDEV